MKIRDYKKDLIQRLSQSDYAAVYLQEVMENEGQEEFLIALRNVFQARSINISKTSKSVGLSRQALYHALSKNGNPTLSTLNQLLDTVGLKLSFSEKDAA